MLSEMQWIQGGNQALNQKTWKEEGTKEMYKLYTQYTKCQLKEKILRRK